LEAEADGCMIVSVAYRAERHPPGRPPPRFTVFIVNCERVRATPGSDHRAGAGQPARHAQHAAPRAAGGLGHGRRDCVGPAGLGGGCRPRAVRPAASQPLGYGVLRLAGAAYLIWLGVSSLRSARRADGSPATGSAPRGFRSRHAYLAGMLSNLLNPKIGVFFVAFLPGFVPVGVPAAAFSLGLGLWFLVETGAWLAALAWMTACGASWLQRATARRWLERLTGVALIGIGLGLAADAR
jgi:arginine exporter protein ArgO